MNSFTRFVWDIQDEEIEAWLDKFKNKSNKIGLNPKYKTVNSLIIYKVFNLDKFIADSVTFRPQSMFLKDIEANSEMLTRKRKIRDKRINIAEKAKWLKLFRCHEN